MLMTSLGGDASAGEVFDPHDGMTCLISEFELDPLATTMSGHANRISSVPDLSVWPANEDIYL